MYLDEELTKLVIHHQDLLAKWNLFEWIPHYLVRWHMVFPLAFLPSSLNIRGPTMNITSFHSLYSFVYTHLNNILFCLDHLCYHTIFFAIENLDKKYRIWATISRKSSRDGIKVTLTISNCIKCVLFNFHMKSLSLSYDVNSMFME